MNRLLGRRSKWVISFAFFFYHFLAALVDFTKSWKVPYYCCLWDVNYSTQSASNWLMNWFRWFHAELQTPPLQIDRYVTELQVRLSFIKLLESVVQCMNWNCLFTFHFSYFPGRLSCFKILFPNNDSIVYNRRISPWFFYNKKFWRIIN